MRPNRLSCLLLCVAMSYVTSSPMANAALPDQPLAADTSAAYFRLGMTRGEAFANVFSKTISIKGQGFKEFASRISGSADYTVSDPNPDRPVFDMSYRYDAFTDGASKVEIRDDGKSVCFDGKCQVDAESSGLAFNPLLWGELPATLKPNMSWQVSIKQPWEMGPPGTENVRVVSLDPANHMAILARQGSGSGESDSEDAHSVHITVGDKTEVATVIPGPSHWTGQTIFQHGIILSDVMLVERPVTLVSKLGTFQGIEREYTLLNSMPPSS